MSSTSTPIPGETPVEVSTTSIHRPVASTDQFWTMVVDADEATSSSLKLTFDRMARQWKQFPEWGLQYGDGAERLRDTLACGIYLIDEETAARSEERGNPTKPSERRQKVETGRRELGRDFMRYYDLTRAPFSTWKRLATGGSDWDEACDVLGPYLVHDYPKSGGGPDTIPTETDLRLKRSWSESADRQLERSKMYKQEHFFTRFFRSLNDILCSEAAPASVQRRDGRSRRPREVGGKGGEGVDGSRGEEEENGGSEEAEWVEANAEDEGEGRSSSVSRAGA